MGIGALINRHRKAIMGFAALYIFLFHEYLRLSPDGSWLGEIMRRPIRWGFVGVDIFFFLSGIGLTYAIGKTGILKFYYRRLRRVAFPYIVTGVVLAFIQNWTFSKFIGNVTGFNFFAKTMYSFLWFVTAVVTFYLLFPLYDKIMGQFKNKVVFTGIVLCIWLLLSMSLESTMAGAGRTEFYGFTNRIPVFVLGVMFGRITQERDIIVSRSGWVLIGLLHVIGLFLAEKTCFSGWRILVPVSNCCIPNILSGITLVMLLAKLMDLLSRFKVMRAVEKGIGYFGVISLEFYCIQGVVLHFILLDRLPAGLAKPLYNLIAFAGTTAMATVLYLAERGFWFLVELPFRKKKVSASQPAPQEVPAESGEPSEGTPGSEG
ncbi:MAG: acyltransferase [Clostridia bacterium]|nr:acyltransferase [Clostridia bacterium]